MAVIATWHGHACWSIEGGGAHLLIDPFLTGNPKADVGPEEVDPDYILVSHAHGDHFGDTLAIGERTGAGVISNDEIAGYCEAKALEAHHLHIGGGRAFPFGRVKLTPALHGSTFPDGSSGGSPCGFLLEIEGKRIYDAADTGLTRDMELLAEEAPVDLALLPIGDNYTMGPDDALRAVGMIKPKVVIPMHYSTFDLIEQDAGAFAETVESAGFRCVILEPGESLAL